MQEQTTSLKWWKSFASLTMIALATIFEMNFVEEWQSSQTHKFFIIQSGVWGAVFISPNAIPSFSLWWPKWNNFSSLSTSCCTSLVYGIYPILHHTWALTISPVLHGFQSSEGGLNHLLQMCAPDYPLWSSCDPAFSSHLSPFSAIQLPHRDACCQQQHRCLIPAHSPKNFQAPIQEP